MFLNCGAGGGEDSKVAAPREGSGMCHLHWMGHSSDTRAGGVKGEGSRLPLFLQLCQDLVCWAVILEGHGTQAAAWERGVSAKPCVACLYSPCLSLPVIKPLPLFTYLPTAHLPAPLSSCPPQSILLEVKEADPCRVPAGGWALVMG